MMPSRLMISVVALACTFAVAHGLADHEERCTITEGSGISVDSCDGSKFLTCKGGRCACPDNVNHIYTFKYESEKSRSKRSPKKSKGGSVLKGAAIAGGSAYVGYKVGQAVNGGSSGSSSGSRNSNNVNKGKKVHSCYGRVGAQCNLDVNQFNIVSITTTSTTTSAPTSAPATVSNPAEANATTIVATTTTESSSTSSSTSAPAALPVPAAQVADVPKMPKCVAHAVCNPRSNVGSSGNTTHVVKITLEGDPRIGVCECGDGYQHQKSNDICVKSFGDNIHSSVVLVVGLLLANRIFSL